MDHYTKDYKITIPHLKSREGGLVSYNRILGDFTYDYSQKVLNDHRLHAVNFCFFILWNADKLGGRLNHTIWMKRELSIQGGGTIDLASPLFAERFYENDHLPDVRRDMSYFREYGIECQYMLIKDLHGNDNIGECENVAVQIEVEPDTGGLAITPITLADMNRILLDNSNGPFKNKKPLNLYETDLEHYLSIHAQRTGALFPGDCDMMLYDDDNRCQYIIEFKKCTARGNIPIKEQSFWNYIAKDRSKFLRLNILRNDFSRRSNREIPLLNVFYPTTNERTVKVEEIRPDMGVGRSWCFPLASEPERNQRMILDSIEEHFPRWGN